MTFFCLIFKKNKNKNQPLKAGTAQYDANAVLIVCDPHSFSEHTPMSLMSYLSGPG